MPLFVILLLLFAGQQIIIKENLLCKIEIDGLQRTESFEAFAEVVKTLICDIADPVVIGDFKEDIDGL